ncbi:MAG: ATPase, T2SS/T4P/T4SS family [archaeon]
MLKGKILEEYEVNAHGEIAKIQIVEISPFHKVYVINLPAFGKATMKVLDEIKTKILHQLTISPKEFLDPKARTKIKAILESTAKQIFENVGFRTEESNFLIARLLNEMLGLGDLEVLLADENLEEIAVNNSHEKIWVYHKIYGWLETTLKLSSEDEIFNLANNIGRKVGKQITTLTPLMDAYLYTGDRVNATLAPISQKGNTITIRKFARKPWTITQFIALKTISSEVAALIWEAVQYELNIMVTGGTGSGKTSFLNVMAPFIQPNHRIISIEDTRELNLPERLHWIPLVTRTATPEGKGEVSMLDLMINSLRMRPDRLFVGEIRRHQEAEVLFEAMHTGHSVYSTVHAENADQLKRRLTTPPISISEELLESLHLIVVQYRHRRLGIRRTYEVAEIVPSGMQAGKVTMDVRTLYKWKAKEDVIVKDKDSLRLFDELMLVAGFTPSELKQDLSEKKAILDFMVKSKIFDLNNVCEMISLYYASPEEVLKKVRR